MIDVLIDVHISAINHFDYCPRRCDYMFVEHIFDDHKHTVEGLKPCPSTGSGRTY